MIRWSIRCVDTKITYSWLSSHAHVTLLYHRNCFLIRYQSILRIWNLRKTKIGEANAMEEGFLRQIMCPQEHQDQTIYGLKCISPSVYLSMGINFSHFAL